jgi:hypothetical protein
VDVEDVVVVIGYLPGWAETRRLGQPRPQQRRFTPPSTRRDDHAK